MFAKIEGRDLPLRAIGGQRRGRRERAGGIVRRAHGQERRQAIDAVVGAPKQKRARVVIEIAHDLDEAREALRETAFTHETPQPRSADCAQSGAAPLATKAWL
jgi:hypothetical protein